jgi:hypothetical protein
MKETIFEMYKNIPVGKNEICKECNKDGDLETPLSIYFVGEKFHSSETQFNHLLKLLMPVNSLQWIMKMKSMMHLTMQTNSSLVL